MGASAMCDAPIVVPNPIGNGCYECPLSPGSICRPFLGTPTYRVVDDCGTPCCSLWVARHNTPFDCFGAHIGYKPDVKRRCRA